jgi:hypothetical protein
MTTIQPKILTEGAFFVVAGKETGVPLPAALTCPCIYQSLSGSDPASS